MQDPGLTNRLRQHSRRAGLAVGLSMALTIAVCVGVPVMIYAQLNPLAGDFIPADDEDEPIPTQTPRPAAEAAQAPAEEEEESAPTEAPEAAPTEPPPTPTPEGFVPTHIVDSTTAVNFRSEPNRDLQNQIRPLEPGTTLQFLDERQLEAAYGENWIRCRLEDGTEGWILEGTTSTLEPPA